jgi:hypothetical protein
VGAFGVGGERNKNPKNNILIIDIIKMFILI